MDDGLDDRRAEDVEERRSSDVNRDPRNVLYRRVISISELSATPESELSSLTSSLAGAHPSRKLAFTMAGTHSWTPHPPVTRFPLS